MNQQCNKCGKELPLTAEHYRVRLKNRLGFSRVCINCDKLAHNAAYHARKPESKTYTKKPREPDNNNLLDISYVDGVLKANTRSFMNPLMKDTKPHVVGVFKYSELPTEKELKKDINAFCKPISHADRYHSYVSLIDIDIDAEGEHFEYTFGNHVKHSPNTPLNLEKFVQQIKPSSFMDDKEVEDYIQKMKNKS